MDSNGRIEIIRTVERVIYDTIPQLQQNANSPYPCPQYPSNPHSQHPSYFYHGGYMNQRDNFQTKFLPQPAAEIAPNASTKREPLPTSLQMEMIRQRIQEQNKKNPINLPSFDISLNTTIADKTVQDEPNSTIKNSSANFDSLSSSSRSSTDDSLSLSHNGKRPMTTSTPIGNRSISFRNEPLPRLSCIPSSPHRSNTNSVEKLSSFGDFEKSSRDETLKFSGNTTKLAKNTSKLDISKNASSVNNTVQSNRSMKLRDETNTIKGREESLQRSIRKPRVQEKFEKDFSPENPAKSLCEEPRYVHKDTPALRRFKANHLSRNHTSKLRSTSLTFSPQNRHGSLRDLAGRLVPFPNSKSGAVQTIPLPEFHQFDDSPLSLLNSPNAERNFDELLSQTRKNKTMLTKVISEIEELHHGENTVEISSSKKTVTLEEKPEDAELEEDNNERSLNLTRESLRRSQRTSSSRLSMSDDNVLVETFAKTTAPIEDDDFERIDHFDVSDNEQVDNVSDEKLSEDQKDSETVSKEIESIPEEIKQLQSSSLEQPEQVVNGIEVIEEVKSQNIEINNIVEEKMVPCQPVDSQTTPKQTKNITSATTFCNISVQVTPNLYSNSHWNLDNDSRVFDSSESRGRITSEILTEGFSETSIPTQEKASLCESTRRSSRIQERSFAASETDDNGNPSEDLQDQLSSNVQKIVLPQMDISISQDEQGSDNREDSDKENCFPLDFVPGDSGDHLHESDNEADDEDDDENMDEEQQVLMSEDSQPENRMPLLNDFVEEKYLSAEPLISYPSSEDEAGQNEDFLYDETFHAFTKLDRSSFVVKRKSDPPLSPPQEKRLKIEKSASLEVSLEKSRRMVLGEIILPLASTLPDASECLPCTNEGFNISLKTNSTVDRSKEEQNNDDYGDSIEVLFQAELEKPDESFKQTKLVDYSQSLSHIERSSFETQNLTKSIRKSTKNPLVDYSSVLFENSNEEFSENDESSRNQLNGTFIVPKTTIEVLGEIGEETFNQEYNPNATYVKSTIAPKMIISDEEDEEQIEEIKSLIKRSISQSSKTVYSNQLVDYSICSSSEDERPHDVSFGNDYDDGRASSSEEDEPQFAHESFKKSTKNFKSIRNRSLEDSAVSLSPSDQDFDVSNADAIIRPRKTLTPQTRGLRRSKRNRVPICALWLGQKPVYRPEIDQFGNYVQSLVGVTSARAAPISERRYVPRPKASRKKSKSHKSKKRHSSHKARKRVIVSDSEEDPESENSSHRRDSSDESSDENIPEKQTEKSQKSKPAKEGPKKKNNMSQFLEMSMHVPVETLPEQDESVEGEGKHFLDFSSNNWSETKSPGVFNCLQSKDVNGASGSMKFNSFAKRNNLKCSSYSLQCWISYGVFLVTVGTQSHVVKPGDFFKVPVGGGYSLENLRDDYGLVNYQVLFSKITSK